MTPHEADRLAAAANALRPDWPTPSIRSYLLASHAHRGYRDTAAALAYIATDPDTRTPKRLEQDGPWWRVGVEQPQQPRRRDPAEAAAPFDRAAHACAVAARATDQQRADALTRARRATQETP
jgi:hypothetical protein